MTDEQREFLLKAQQMSRSIKLQNRSIALRSFWRWRFRRSAQFDMLLTLPLDLMSFTSIIDLTNWLQQKN